MKKNSFETILYSAIGVVALLLILVAFNAITATLKQRVDLTKDKAYTLSAGTRAILQKLDTPVKIRFYYYGGEGGAQETVMPTPGTSRICSANTNRPRGAKSSSKNSSPSPTPTRRIPRVSTASKASCFPTARNFTLASA
jgi:hypothetical protein